MLFKNKNIDGGMVEQDGGIEILIHPLNINQLILLGKFHETQIFNVNKCFSYISNKSDDKVR